MILQSTAPTAWAWYLVIAVFAIALGLWGSRRPWRSTSDERHCPECGFLLPGVSSPRCPACGESI